MTQLRPRAPVARRPAPGSQASLCRAFGASDPLRNCNHRLVPGLTLVVGRNGTGKSSFAEGLEFTLTGQNSRWQDSRSTAWKGSWRNLHHEGPASITARFSIDGAADDKNVTLRWPDGDTDWDSGIVEGLDELGLG